MGQTHAPIKVDTTSGAAQERTGHQQRSADQDREGNQAIQDRVQQGGSGGDAPGGSSPLDLAMGQDMSCDSSDERWGSGAEQQCMAPDRRPERQPERTLSCPAEDPVDRRGEMCMAPPPQERERVRREPAAPPVPSGPASVAGVWDEPGDAPLFGTLNLVETHGTLSGSYAGHRVDADGERHLVRGRLHGFELDESGSSYLGRFDDNEVEGGPLVSGALMVRRRDPPKLLSIANGVQRSGDLTPSAWAVDRSQQERADHAERSDLSQLMLAARTLGPPYDELGVLVGFLANHDPAMLRDAHRKVVPDQSSTVEACKALWHDLTVAGLYSHERLVLHYWLSRFGGTAIDADRLIELLSHRDAATARLRIRALLTSNAPRADKLRLTRDLVDYVRSDVRVEDWTGPQDTGEWAPLQAVMPAPPKLDEIETLPQAIRLADAWEVGLHAYVEVEAQMCAAIVDDADASAELATENIARNRGFFTWMASWFDSGPQDMIDGFEGQREDAAERKKSALERQALNKGGTSAAHRLIDAVRAVRAKAEQGVAELQTLEPIARNPDAEGPDATEVVERAHAILVETLEGLRGLNDPVSEHIAAIETMQWLTGLCADRAQRTRAELDELRSQTGLGQLWTALTDAVSTMVDKLKEVDWGAALEIGLEVLGTVLTGGAALVVKLLAWVARLGGEIAESGSLITPLTEVVEGLKQAGSAALDAIFSPAGVLTSVVGLVFGVNPLAGVQVDPGAAKATAGLDNRGDDKGFMGLLGRAAAGFGAVYGKLADGVGWAASGVRRLDLSQNPMFRTLAAGAGWLIRKGSEVWESASGMLDRGVDVASQFLLEVFANVRGWIDGAMQGVGRVLAIVASPATFLVSLIGKGVAWLLGKMVTKPPSKLLEVALKAAGVTASAAGEMLLKLFDGFTQSIGLGKFSETIGGALADSDLFKPFAQAVAPAQKTLADLGGGALSAVSGVEASTKAYLADAPSFAKNVLGVSPDSTGGAGAAAGPFAQSLQDRVVELADDASFDPIANQAAKDTEEGPSSDVDVAGFLDALLGRTDWTDFLDSLSMHAYGAVTAWRRTCDTFVAANPQAMKQVADLAGASLDPNGWHTDQTGSRRTLDMTVDEWKQVQQLFATTCAFRYLTTLSDFGKGADGKPLGGGVSGARAWLAAQGGRAFASAAASIATRTGGDTLFGSRPAGDKVTLRAQGGRVALSFEATGSARDARLEALSRDPDHGGKITPGTRAEAEAALGLEEAGRLPALVRRPEPGDGHGGCDFVDGRGVDWDVKAFRSRPFLEAVIRQKKEEEGQQMPRFNPNRKLKGEFDLDTVMHEIEKQFAGNENVIVDTRSMTPEDERVLREAIQSGGHDARVEFFPVR